MQPGAKFTHERLEAYPVAQAFQLLALTHLPREGCARMRGQVHRDTQEVILHLCEIASGPSVKRVATLRQRAIAHLLRTMATLESLRAEKILSADGYLDLRGLGLRLHDLLEAAGAAPLESGPTLAEVGRPSGFSRSPAEVPRPKERAPGSSPNGVATTSVPGAVFDACVGGKKAGAPPGRR